MRIRRAPAYSFITGIRVAHQFQVAGRACFVASTRRARPSPRPRKAGRTYRRLGSARLASTRRNATQPAGWPSTSASASRPEKKGGVYAPGNCGQLVAKILEKPERVPVLPKQSADVDRFGTDNGSDLNALARATGHTLRVTLNRARCQRRHGVKKQTRRRIKVWHWKA